MVGDEILEGDACAGNFVTADKPQLRRLGEALSPEGHYLAQTKPGGDNHYTTSITSVVTGETLHSVEWQAPDRLGEIDSGGQWLTDDRFLIYETTEEPLLLTIGQGITKVASELFGLPSDSICQSASCDVTLQATGAALEGTDAYHIVLNGAGIESQLPLLRLYHSENGTVEELAMDKHGGFSPDGRILLQYHEAMTDTARYTVRIAPVDSPNQSTYPVMAIETSPFPLAWSSDSSQVAVSNGGGVTLLTTEDGRAVRSWRAEGWTIAPTAWSPDGQHLALRGTLAGEQQEALFIVDGRH